MRSLWRTALVFVAAFAVVTLVVIVIWRINYSKHPVDTATVAAADLAALAIAVPLLTALAAWWWKARWSAIGRASTSAQAAAAADRLATMTEDRWRQEASKRRIVTPAPATIRWRWAADDLTASRADAATPPPPGTGPLSFRSPGEPGELLGSGVVSRLHDEVYARLPHGRLVLVGGPGAGKTGAMILLLLAALARRESLTGDQRSRVPVPLWLTLGGWNPDSTTLQEWAISTMNRDHPFLRAPDYGPNAAQELLRCGLVALFLDGLDEMPEQTRAHALRRIGDEAQGLRIVVTSRTEEYRQALQADRLDNTAVIEMRPVRPAAAAAYLLRDQVGPSYKRWERLAVQLTQNPESAAAQALDNPLFLSLARDAYVSGNPAVLADVGKFPTAETVREHLIDQVLITAYPNENQRESATQWLAWIAHRMGTSRDLLWWSIPSWVPRWQLRLAAGLEAGIGAGIGAGLCFGFGLPMGLALGARLEFGLGFGLVSGLAAGLLPRKSFLEPHVVIVRRPRADDLGRILTVELLLALACLFAAGGLGDWLSHLDRDNLGFTLVSVIFVVLLSIPVGWLPFGLFNLWATPIAKSPSASAAGTYHSDRRASAIYGFAVGGAAGFTPGLLFGLNSGWLVGLIFGLVVFAVGSLAGRLRGQVPMVRLTEFILVCQGRGRVHFLRLVEDAFSRQVLRQAGTVYQFRHAALQDHLSRVDYHFPASSKSRSVHEAQAAQNIGGKTQ